MLRPQPCDRSGLDGVSSRLLLRPLARSSLSGLYLPSSHLPMVSGVCTSFERLPFSLSIPCLFLRFATFHDAIITILPALPSMIAKIGSLVARAPSVCSDRTNSMDFGQAVRASAATNSHTLLSETCDPGPAGLHKVRIMFVLRVRKLCEVGHFCKKISYFLTTLIYPFLPEWNLETSPSAYKATERKLLIHGLMPPPPSASV